MTRHELEVRTQRAFKDTREVLELVIAELNKGQRKKLLKNEKIAELFTRYCVKVDDDNKP